MKRLNVILVLVMLLTTSMSQAQIKKLQTWLEVPRQDRSSLQKCDFANTPLSKKDADLASKMLLADKLEEVEENYCSQWNNRKIVFQDHQMPFYYNLFGEKPADGRSLFISLHGGGGTAPHVNDKQYNNQKHLYDATMKNMEGVYLAMRAPTDTWNMWHQNDIDDFINIIIQMATIKEDVNPNKVYILGYSAGGDGLYQLAPRMADRFAAASMMAGHPGDASPNNLYNLPFAIHVGANDSSYNRNTLALKWKNQLDSLELAKPGHYKHQAQIHKAYGHWMKLQDAVALPWMAQFKRNPLPEKIVWRQDNRYHEQFYWLWNHNFQPRAGKTIVAEYNKKDNKVNVIETYTNTIQVLLNDKMLDLDKPVSFSFKGKLIYKGKIKRSIANIVNSLKAKGDVNYIFPSKVYIDVEKNKQAILK